MKINMPVTDNEALMKKSDILVTRTDLKGRITYANNAFVAISGFTREELIGASHNIVRHPDMPEAAFTDLWTTLKQGKPWQMPVKNRTKSGDYYWVEANVIPVYKNGQVDSCLSVRYMPKREQIDAANALYQQLNAKTAKLRPTGLAALLKLISESSAAIKVTVGLTALLAPVAWLMLPLFSSQQYMQLTVVTGSVLLGAALIIKLMLDMTDTLESAINALYSMSGGYLRNKFKLNRNNQLGDLLRALYAMQVNLNLSLAESAQLGREALQINQALDVVNSGVMVTNTRFEIIYMNHAVQEIFKKAEQDIRKQLPDFNADKLLGANIDFFHKNPAYQRNMLEKLTRVTSVVRSEIVIGGHHLVVVVHPVINESGERIGFVTEWLDRTVEVKTEQEIEKVVDAAAQGDFSLRINEHDKEGFFLTLAQTVNVLVDTSDKGLNDVVRMLEALAGGDLTQKITNNYSGTFGQLKDDSNATVDKLKEMISEIIVASDTIQTAAREIAAGNNDLSHRTEEQAASIEQTAASMEELTSTVQANTQNAKHASQLAVESSDIAAKGVNVVGQVVMTMEEINQSSHKIGDIISVIDDIAFQTNILALNAAVEAARAGESGKGFAVVAVEVRNLAQRAAKAAGEIKELIHDSVGKVQSGSKLVSEAGKTMGEIVTAIRGVTEIMSQIAAASTEQSAGISQVNQAIGQMDNVTQQNAALVEQAAAAAESMEEQVQNLSATVGYFNVDGNARGLSRASYVAKANPVIKTAVSQSKAVTKPKTQPPVVAESDEWEEF